MKKKSNLGRGTAKKPPRHQRRLRMILFEATNGMCGHSYERCYVWAISEDRARALILANATLVTWPDNRNYGAIKYSLGPPPPNLVACWRLRPILYSDDGEFITKISTDGWER